MSIKDELKSLWTAANQKGLTLDGATKLIDSKGFGEWGTSTVRDTVNGKGKDIRELVLRKVLREYLGAAESVKNGPAKSATSPVEVHEPEGEYRTAREWQQEALRLREENAVLRAVIQLLAAPRVPLSSAAIAKAEEFLRNLIRQMNQKPPGDPGP